MVFSFNDFARYFYIRHLVFFGSVVEGAPEYTSFVRAELTIVLITLSVVSFQFPLQTGSCHLAVFALAV